ncbi:hypothetical protein S245_002789, partial [Arachis hypogaea]
VLNNVYGKKKYTFTIMSISSFFFSSIILSLPFFPSLLHWNPLLLFSYIRDRWSYSPSRQIQISFHFHLADYAEPGMDHAVSQECNTTHHFKGHISIDTWKSHEYLCGTS